jgi:hypothetical protein
MTGVRSQRSMKRGSTPTPFLQRVTLFSREAISLIERGERNRDVTTVTRLGYRQPHGFHRLARFTDVRFAPVFDTIIVDYRAAWKLGDMGVFQKPTSALRLQLSGA